MIQNTVEDTKEQNTELIMFRKQSKQVKKPCVRIQCTQSCLIGTLLHQTTICLKYQHFPTPNIIKACTTFKPPWNMCDVLIHEIPPRDKNRWHFFYLLSQLIIWFTWQHDISELISYLWCVCHFNLNLLLFLHKHWTLVPAWSTNTACWSWICGSTRLHTHTNDMDSYRGISHTSVTMSCFSII